MSQRRRRTDQPRHQVRDWHWLVLGLAVVGGIEVIIIARFWS